MQDAEGVTVPLYPHQIKGIDLIEALEFTRTVKLTRDLCDSINADIYFFDSLRFNPDDNLETRVGIYGDITGYGKTLTMLAYLAKYYRRRRGEADYLVIRKHEETVKRLYIDTDFICHSGRKERHYQLLPQTLIIVNRQIANQWTTELARTDLKRLVITKRRDVPEEVNSLESYEVVLITDTMSKHLHNVYQKYQWSRLIIDEPTENYVPQFYRASFYWMITASYQSIPVKTNKTSIYKHLFPISRCNAYLKALVIKNNDDFVKKSYAMPQLERILHQCYERSLAFLAKSHLPPDIAAMIAAGNLREAIHHLGGSSTDVNIVDLVTRNKRQQLEEAEFKYNKYHQRYVIDKIREAKTSYEKWRERKSQLQIEIEELQKKYSASLEAGCSVCTDDFSTNKIVLVPCCQNVVCGVCLFTWMKKQNNCIFCRTNMEPNRLIYLDHPSNDKRDETVNVTDKVKIGLRAKRLTRLEAIVNLLKGNPLRRFIVVSSYDETFQSIKNHLDAHDINHTEIKGNKAHIDRELENLRNGNCRVLFLNGSHQGTGLNLQFMTDIVLYHEMDQTLVTQVVGRINRIGSNELRGFIKPQLHEFNVNHW